MELKVLKIQEKPSKYGGKFYYIFFKDQSSGKSYRTCVFPQCRNYGAWNRLIRDFTRDTDHDFIARGLRVKKGTLLDADCFAGVRKIAKQQEMF